MNPTTRNTYFDEEGKQLRPFPDKWLTPRRTLKVGNKVELLKGKGTFKTICYLSDEGEEWVLHLPSFKSRGVSGRIRAYR